MRFCHLRASRCTDPCFFSSTQVGVLPLGFHVMNKYMIRRFCLLVGMFFPFHISACDTLSNADHNKTTSGTRKSDPIGVKTITLKRDPSPVFVKRFSGIVKPVRSSELSFSQAGKISDVLVDIGSLVEKGAILARLDDERYQKKVNALKSQLSVAQTDLNLLDQPITEQDRQKLVSKINQLRSELDLIEFDLKKLPPSSSELESLNRKLQNNKEQIESVNQKSRQQKIAGLTSKINDLKSQLQEVNISLRALDLVAPYSGVITEKKMDVGSVISPGRSVLKIANFGSYRIMTGLPAELAANLKVGQVVSLKQDQQTFLGKVTSIYPMIDPLTQTRMVVLQPDDSQTAGEITAGERVDVLITIPESKSGFWLPISALIKEIEGLWSVYLVQTIEGKPTVVRHYVEVIEVGNDQALVSGNLSEGMSVVVDGLHRIVPGQIVRQAEQKKKETKGDQKPEQVSGQ